MTMNQNFDHLYNTPVVDDHDLPLGRVKDLYLDDESGRPSFITVSGEAGKHLALPVHSLPTEQKASLKVPYTREFIEHAPRVSEDHISEEEQEAIFSYYQREGTAVSETSVEHESVEHEHAQGQGSEDAPASPDTSPEGSITLHEEVAHVSTREREQEGGRVRLRKHVRTEQESVTVPVTHEEVRVTRTPLEGHEVDGHAFQQEVVPAEVTLHEEEVVVDKDVVAKEAVTLSTEAVTEHREVPVEVRKEEVEVEHSSELSEERPLKEGHKDFHHQEEHRGFGEKLKDAFRSHDATRNDTH